MRFNVLIASKSQIFKNPEKNMQYICTKIIFTLRFLHEE